MFKLKTRPYNLLIIAAIILLVASFFTLNETLDIHLYDTYYIIPTAYASWAIVLFLLMLWVVYLFTNRWLFSKTLVWLHVVLTVVTSLFMFIYVFNFRELGGMAGMPRRYMDYSDWDIFWQYQRSIIVSVILLAFGLVLHILNLLIGLIRRRQTGIY